MHITWVIAKNSRCDLVTFSGVNYSGRESRVQIFPSGRQGDITSPIRSMIYGAPAGMRLVLCVSPVEAGWMERPWRALVMTPTNSFRTRQGKFAIRVPDIEALDKPDARRTDPDFRASYNFAETLEDGNGWSYGRVGPLHDQIQMIRVDRAE